MRHRVQREGAAPAPTPPAQAPRIELRNLDERRIDHGQLIFKLHRTEVAVGHLREGAAAEAHAAIVSAEHGESLLREDVVEEQVVVPLIHDFLGVGSAVGIDDEGNGGGIGRARGHQ